MRQWTGPTLIQVMAWRLLSAKPLPEKMLPYCQLKLGNKLQWNLNQNIKLLFMKCTWKCRLWMSRGRWVKAWWRICQSVYWVIIGAGYATPPVRHQTISWTNADLLTSGPLGREFNEILLKILRVPFNKMSFNMSSANWRSFRSGLVNTFRRSP